MPRTQETDAATPPRRLSAGDLVERASSAIRSAFSTSRARARRRPATLTSTREQGSEGNADVVLANQSQLVKDVGRGTPDPFPSLPEANPLTPPPPNQAALRAQCPVPTKSPSEKARARANPGPPQKLDPYNMELFNQSNALEKYKLRSIPIFFSEMERHPAQRPLQQEILTSLLKSFKAVGIERNRPHGHLGVIIEGVNLPSQLPTDCGALLQGRMALVISGGHRLHAGLQYKEYLKKTGTSPPNVRAGVEVGWWTCDVYSDELLDDEMALHTGMQTLNESTDPTANSDAQKIRLVMRFAHEPNAEQFLSSSLRNPAMVRAVKVLLRSKDIPPLLETLLESEPFNIMVTSKFVEKLAANQALMLARLILQEYVLWYRQLALRSRTPSGIQPGTLQFFQAYGLLSRGFSMPKDTARDGFDFEDLADDMKQVSPILRDSSGPILLGDRFAIWDVVYTPTLLSAPNSEMCMLYSASCDVIDGMVQYLVGEREHKTMSSKAQTKGGFPHVSLRKHAEGWFRMLAYMESCKNGDVEVISICPDPSTVPDVCDLLLPRSVILRESEDFMLHIYRYLWQDGLALRLSAQLHASDKHVGGKTIAQGSKAERIQGLVAESPDWHQFLCQIPTSAAHKGRHAFSYGAGVVHPFKTPAVTNAEREKDCESFELFHKSTAKALKEKHKIATLQKDLEELDSEVIAGDEEIDKEFETQCKQKLAECRESLNALKNARFEKKLDIRKKFDAVKDQLSTLEENADLYLAENFPSVLDNSQPEAAMKDQIDALQVEYEAQRPVAPYQPPKNCIGIVRQSIICHEDPESYHQVGNYIRELQDSEGYKRAFELKAEPLGNVLKLLVQPRLSRLLLSGSVEKVLKELLEENTSLAPEEIIANTAPLSAGSIVSHPPLAELDVEEGPSKRKRRRTPVDVGEPGFRSPSGSSAPGTAKRARTAMAQAAKPKKALGKVDQSKKAPIKKVKSKQYIDNDSD